MSGDLQTRLRNPWSTQDGIERGKSAAWEHDLRIEAADEIDRLKAQVVSYEKALTPSAETKYAFIGEFKFTHSTFDEDLTLCIPWTSIKEIMHAIRERARLDLLEFRG